MSSAATTFDLTPTKPHQIKRAKRSLEEEEYVDEEDHNVDAADDIEALKRLVTTQKEKITTQQAEIRKLKKQVKELLEANPNAVPAVDPSTMAAQIKKSLKTQLSSQMVYKNSLKGSGKAQLKAEAPSVSFAVFELIFGKENVANGSNGPKQAKLSLDAKEMNEVFDEHLGKGLRYGASLEIVDKVSVTFDKTTGVIKISGKYTMVK